MEKQHNIPCIYLQLQKRLIEISKDGKCEITKMNGYFGKVHLPKILLPPILKEMEQFGLLKRDGKFNVKIENPNHCKILETPIKIYRRLEIF